MRVAGVQSEREKEKKRRGEEEKCGRRREVWEKKRSVGEEQSQVGFVFIEYSKPKQQQHRTRHGQHGLYA